MPVRRAGAAFRPVLRSRSLAAAAVLAALGLGAVPGGTGPAAAAAPPGGVGQLAPLVFQGLRPPIPFTGSDGRTHLTYVLTLQNAGPVPVRLDRVAVLDGRGGRVIASYAGESMTSKLGLLSSPIEPLASATLQPSQAGAFWVDVVLDRTRGVPRSLRHRITATPLGTSFYEGRDTVTAAPLRVARARPVRLAAPLAGDDWIDLTGCCTGVPNHRHALFSASGQLFAAQEFAIDFMRFDARRRLFAGDARDPKAYTAYGAPVLAVADARVVAASDGLPDQVPGAPEPVVPADADGNFVMLDLGDGRYANYAHLAPGSVRVERGDRVRTGQRLGLVGNSGQTGVPHLHFHVMNRPLLADAVGLPFEFRRFVVQGVADLDSVDRAVTTGTTTEVDPSGAGPRRNQLPLELTVLDFP